MAYLSETYLWKMAQRHPEDEVEIGSVQLEIPMSVCLIAKSTGGEYVFSKEVEAKISWRTRVVRPFEPFWRLEVKVDKNNGDITPDYDLIVSQLPYSNKWVHFTGFKKSNCHPDRPESNIPASIVDRTVLMEFLDNDAQVDIFEKGKWLTAGISRPFSGSEYSLTKNMGKNAVYLFGACRELAEVNKELLDSEQVRNLLRLTEINRIRFTPERNADGSRLQVAPKLRDEVIENRFNLMALAILQALSGPADSTGYIGAPVLRLVEVCYKKLLHFENRKAPPEHSAGTFEFRDVVAVGPGQYTDPVGFYEDRLGIVRGILSDDEFYCVTSRNGIGCMPLPEDEICRGKGWTKEAYLRVEKHAMEKLRDAFPEYW